MSFYEQGIGNVGGAYGASAGFALPTFGDPRNVFGDAASANAGSSFGSYLRGFGTDPIDRFAQQAAREMQTWGQSAQPGMSGPMATPGGDWSGVDQWSSQIAAAAAQTGVPANLIKAIMRVESNGDPGAGGAPGVVGLMQINTNAWGMGPWVSDNAANILKGAQILKSNYAQHGSWDMAMQAYLGFGTDMLGTDNYEYRDMVMNYWNELNSWGGSGFNGSPGTPGQMGGSTLSSMFPGASVPDWGEFNIPSGNGLYGYGTGYGLNGSNHTGIDIPLPLNTPFYAPMGGTVTCGGTGVGSGAEGGGCAAFNDYHGDGAGRVEIQLDSGAVLIYGHSSRSAVRPGQRVNAGTLLGYSGGMNSDHIHLEARVRDGSTSSGWRIVDPRTVIGGATFAPGPGGMGMPGMGQQPMGGDWWNPGGADPLSIIFGIGSR